MRRPWTSWSTAVAWLFLAFAILLEARAARNTLGYDLASPDPPAHFTTGVMLFDYVRHSSAPPFHFAECFYVRYPKVAFGHWPPVFYIVECLWFLIFGATVAAARWLCAAITATLAVVLFRHCRTYWSAVSGPLAAALFLSAPSIQSQTWEVMSDILVTLFIYLAIARLAAWLDLRMPHDLWWCAAWTVLAILTKGSGWLLVPLVLVTPLLTGRTSAYRSWIYWLSLTLVVAVAAPFFLYMEFLHLGYPAGIVYQLATLPGARSAGALISGAIAALLLAALLYVVKRHTPRTALQLMCFSMGLWIAGQAGFLAIFPYTADWRRFLLSSLPMFVFLFVGALHALESWAEQRRLPRGMTIILAIGVVMLLPNRAHFDSIKGYAAAIDSIPLRPSGPVVLVESDAIGEGAAIARRLEQDRSRATYVLRGSKMLADASWMGKHYRARYANSDEVRILLDRIPVDYILLDTSVRTTPDALLLRTALEAKESAFAVRSTQPVTGRPMPGDVRVYERRVPRPGPTDVSVTLDPERDHRELSCPDRAW